MTSALMAGVAAPNAEFEARFARVEELLAGLAHSTDPMVAPATREILATVLELHRRGLERMLEVAASENTVREALAADGRISAMLLLHGLHPISLAERVSRTLGTLRERYRSKIESMDFQAHGSTEIAVRVVPAATACQSTRATLKKDLEDALVAAAPDVASLLVEIVEAPPALITLRVRSSAVDAQSVGGER